MILAAFIVLHGGVALGVGATIKSMITGRLASPQPGRRERR